MDFLQKCNMLFTLFFVCFPLNPLRCRGGSDLMRFTPVASTCLCRVRCARTCFSDNEVSETQVLVFMIDFNDDLG